MLDTSIASDLIRNPAGRAAARVRDLGVDAICISIVAAAEMRFGAQRKQSDRLRLRVDALLKEISVIPFEPPADSTYAAVRAMLSALGRMIVTNNLFIAAHALALGPNLITADIGQLSRVRGLKIQQPARMPAYASPITLP